MRVGTVRTLLFSDLSIQSVTLPRHVNSYMCDPCACVGVLVHVFYTAQGLCIGNLTYIGWISVGLVWTTISFMQTIS